jgi:hypothetical protein
MFWIKLLNRKGSGNSEGLSLEPLPETPQSVAAPAIELPSWFQPGRVR